MTNPTELKELSERAKTLADACMPLSIANAERLPGEMMGVQVGLFSRLGKFCRDIEAALRSGSLVRIERVWELGSWRTDMDNIPAYPQEFYAYFPAEYGEEAFVDVTVDIPERGPMIGGVEPTKWMLPPPAAQPTEGRVEELEEELRDWHAVGRLLLHDDPDTQHSGGQFTTLDVLRQDARNLLARNALKGETDNG